VNEARRVEKLRPDHPIESFDCGREELNRYLQKSPTGNGLTIAPMYNPPAPLRLQCTPTVTVAEQQLVAITRSRNLALSLRLFEGRRVLWGYFDSQSGSFTDFQRVAFPVNQFKELCALAIPLERSCVDANSI
jgi:hypothetical protein